MRVGFIVEIRQTAPSNGWNRWLEPYGGVANVSPFWPWWSFYPVISGSCSSTFDTQGCGPAPLPAIGGLLSLMVALPIKSQETLRRIRPGDSPWLFCNLAAVEKHLSPSLGQPLWGLDGQQCAGKPFMDSLANWKTLISERLSRKRRSRSCAVPGPASRFDPEIFTNCGGCSLSDVYGGRSYRRERDPPSVSFDQTSCCQIWRTSSSPPLKKPASGNCQYNCGKANGCWSSPLTKWWCAIYYHQVCTLHPSPPNPHPLWMTSQPPEAQAFLQKTVCKKLADRSAIDLIKEY